jgi:hypothetical protein
VNVASYQAKVYPDPPCWALVADVYTSELGQEVEGYKTISGSVRQLASAFRVALHKNPDGFTRLEEPVDYAVVLMGRVPALGVHHCGIYYEGKVLHATPEGTLYQDLASLQDAYPVMEFWAK